MVAVSALLIILGAGCGKKKQEPVSEAKPSETTIEETAADTLRTKKEQLDALHADAEKRGLKPGEYTIRHIKGKDPEIVEIPKLLPGKGSGLEGKIDSEYLVKLREKSKVRREARIALHKVNTEIEARKVEIESSNPEYLDLQSRITQLTQELKALENKRNTILASDDLLNKLNEQVKPLEEASQQADMDLYAEIQVNKAKQREKLLEEKRRNEDATSEKADFQVK